MLALDSAAVSTTKVMMPAAAGMPALSKTFTNGLAVIEPALRGDGPRDDEHDDQDRQHVEQRQPQHHRPSRRGMSRCGFSDSAAVTETTSVPM